MKAIVVACVLVLMLWGCSSDNEFVLPVNNQITNQNDTVPPPLELPFAAPCVNGSAGGFPCNGYNLISRIDLDTFGAGRGNDCWGWTDPDTSKEYAIMGLDNGTAFVDISSPAAPIYLGKLPSRSGASPWRDVKVYNNFAFIVSEAGGHGMQVFDLKKLRNVGNPPVSFNADAVYTEFGNAHNIVINESSGYAYAVGTGTYNGGPHFINIQDPLNPVAAGGYSMDNYSHDAQVVTYNGPDTDYSGKEILIGSNENELVIVDITDKANPVSIASVSYNQVGYTHQGWFTEDERYFIVGDELDELEFGFNSRTMVFNFSDLDAPELIGDYLGTTSAIDHNGYVKGNSYYLANYTRGLTVLDVTTAGSANLSETGFFDTHPATNSASFNGAWSVYPFFDSNNIIISDINLGLFVVKR